MRILTGAARDETKRHPCYFKDAGPRYARIHLPVAPACNIQCRYCCRRFDCLNESRPGVVSQILNTEQAMERYLTVKAQIPALSVVGIAGPGDALANWPEVKSILEKIRTRDPYVLFCLSTNGLRLPDYAEELVELGLRHVTITINAVDPKIGAQIYKWVDYDGHRYKDYEAAELLLERQLDGLRILVAHDVLVKVNIVMIKGINDDHIPEVVRNVSRLGALMSNIMPLIPAAGSDFAGRAGTSRRELKSMQDICQGYLTQMTHCQQCRADAVGFLDQDRSSEFSVPGAAADVVNHIHTNKLYRFAVSSRNGQAVDLHFGHSEKFLIFEGDGSTFERLPDRSAPKYCSGPADCGHEHQDRDKIIDILNDCDAVLSMRIGGPVKERLASRGILAIDDCGTVEAALKHASLILIKEQIGY